jgi:DNA replication protein DnaC
MKIEKRICKKHGEYDCTIMDDPFPLASECPQCLAEFEDAEARERETANTTVDRCRWESMNIAPLYYGSTLENFDAYTPGLIDALAKVKALLTNEYQNLIMVGKNGTGKTHLACAALKRIGGGIYTMYEISCMIRESYTVRGKRSELEIVNGLADSPLLVIDEVGRSKGSDSELSWLSYIIDRSHSRGNRLIIISNAHLMADCKSGGCPSCLENYFGDDVLSRLSERGAVVKFEAKDYRRAE